MEFIEDCVEWKHNDDQTYFITVDTIYDDLWEGDETFFIQLINVEGATLNAKYSQTEVTILQNNCMSILCVIIIIINIIIEIKIITFGL